MAFAGSVSALQSYIIHTVFCKVLDLFVLIR